MLLPEATEVVQHRQDGKGFGAAFAEAPQAAPDHLHVGDRALHLMGDQHQVRAQRIEAGGQHAVIAQQFRGQFT